MQKTRPAIIISDDAIGNLPLKVIVPITDWKDHYEQASWMVRIDPETANGLSKTSAADTFQVRCVSTNRFRQKLGELSSDIILDVEDALVVVLGITF